MKKILVVCGTGTTRGEIVSIVKSAGYNVLRVGNDGRAIGFFQNGGIADLIIIGHKTQANEVLTRWIKKNRSGIPIIFISHCECESNNIIVAHTNNDNEIVEKSCLLEELPMFINSILGHPDPLNKSIQ